MATVTTNTAAPKVTAPSLPISSSSHRPRSALRSTPVPTVRSRDRSSGPASSETPPTLDSARLSDSEDFFYPRHDLDKIRRKCNNSKYLAAVADTDLAGTETLSLDPKFLPLLHYDNDSCLKIRTKPFKDAQNSTYKSEILLKFLMSLSHEELEAEARPENVKSPGNPCKVGYRAVYTVITCTANKRNCRCEDMGTGAHGRANSIRIWKTRGAIRYVINALLEEKKTLAALICLFVQEGKRQKLGLNLSHVCNHEDLTENHCCLSPAHSLMETVDKNVLRSRHQRLKKTYHCKIKCIHGGNTKRGKFNLSDKHVIVRGEEEAEEGDETDTDSGVRGSNAPGEMQEEVMNNEEDIIEGEEEWSEE